MDSYFCSWPYWICIYRSFSFRQNICGRRVLKLIMQRDLLMFWLSNYWYLHHYLKLNYLIMMWPFMVTHTQNLCSAFNPSKVHTQQCAHTHTAVNTHTPGAVGRHFMLQQGEFGGSVTCSRAPQSWYWGWRESAVHSLPPPTIPASPRFEFATFRSRVHLYNH